ISIDSKNANVRYQLSQILLNQNKRDEALIHAEKAFALDPKNTWYSKYLIEIYKSTSFLDEAIRVAQTAYKQTQDVHYLYELANLYETKRLPKKALAALNQIEKLKGVSEEISSKKEDIYLKTKNFKGAIKEIEKLNQAFPNQHKYMGMLADLYMRVGRDKDALALYYKIQEADKKNGYAALSLADYYQQKGDANKVFEQMILAMQSSLEPKILTQVLAMLIPSDFFKEEHRQRCRMLIDTFAAYQPNAMEPHLFNGDLAMQERNFELARTHYLKAIKTNNQSMIGWEQLLFCDQQLNNYPQLLEDCENMMEVFPNYAPVYLFHSMAARQLKQYSKAFGSARMGVSLAEDEQSLLQLLSNLGDIAHYAGEFATSDSAFEAALAIEPNSSLTLNNYAYFLSLRNTELDKALNMSKRSLELDPANPSSLDTYGWILFQLTRYEDAKVYLKKSLDLSPNNAEVIDHYGDVLYKLGDKEAALENWKKAQLLGFDSEELTQKIQTKTIPSKK
ncbi:MAG: hypothetical protein MH472_05445, partial [Bacteroidia bacterium]|nr:hypothetical protein [Bacteroidia bacterium]